MSTAPLAVPRLEAARLIGVTAATLRKWATRRPRRGPRPVKVTGRQQGMTLYRLDDLRQWLDDPAGYEARHADD